MKSCDVAKSVIPLPKERIYRPTFDLLELAKKPFLTRYEFAFWLGISVGAVDSRLGSLFPYVKVGARVLIDKEKAIAALERATERKAAK
jgi:hypothetical protein